MSRNPKTRKGRPDMTDADYIDLFKSRSTITDRGCWEWNGFCAQFRNIKPGQRGYPVACYRGKGVRLHRLILALSVRPLQKGEIAMHTCDNPPCWNPQHLRIGTYTDNMRDCSLKGRADEQWKTHCKRGHPLSGDNLIWVSRKGTDLKLRRCVTCQRLRQRIRLGWTWEEALAQPGPIPQGAPTKRRWNREATL